MSDDPITKRERMNDRIIKSIRTQQDRATQDNAELRSEIAEVKARLRKIEQQTPTAPGDAIKKADDEFSDWLGRANPENIRRCFIFDAPERLQ